jgi:hypothetical protein
MNLDAPAQHIDGGWHYVRANRRTGTYPIGYCRDHGPHPTEAEARECYSAFRRDNVRFGNLGDWSGCRIEGCDKPTKRFAAVRYDGFNCEPLCEDHETAEFAALALGLNAPAGNSWHS